MNYNWNNYLSVNEKVRIDFGVSNVYSVSILAVATVIAIVLSFTNIFVGIGTLLLGILYWFYLTRGKRYAFTNKRIILIDSFLGKNVINVDYNKITDITVDQNAIDMMGGWGTIIINTAGSDVPEAVLQNVNNPQMLKNKIDEFAESSKQ
jgi:hypothetical protein